MTWFFKAHYEKILVALAAGVMALCLGETWRQQRELRALGKAIHGDAMATGRSYAPASWGVQVSGRANWGKAPEQSAGAGWLYELFTPPAIYYNSGTRAFAVVGPRQSVSRGTPANSRPVSAAKPERFRLQLTGYFGAPGDYLVAFVSAESGEILLARVGRRFPELGLTLTNFEVKKVPVEHAEAWPVYDVVGFATLRDESDGVDVVLDTRPHKRSDSPRAPLEALAPAGEAHRVTVAGKSDTVSIFPASSESGRSQ